MKTLLLGSNGQLGKTFVLQGGLAARGELVVASRDGTTVGPRSVALDITDGAQLTALLDSERPSVIVNAAAYTAVDKAETDEASALEVNGVAVGVLADWAAANAAHVVHYSTDYVFSGDATTPYMPDAPVGPMGAYGRTKLAGERALAASGASHFLFRTAWVYSAVGHNFLKTMLRLGRERSELKVVADQQGTPTTAALIVAGTLAALDAQAELASSSLNGTYHLTASGDTTWHGFADAIFDDALELGLVSHRPVVHPIPTSQFPTPARRPPYSVLDNRSFTRAFDFPLPDWRKGVLETIDALRGQQ